MADNDNSSTKKAFVRRYVSSVERTDWLICRERARHDFPKHPNKINEHDDDERVVDRIYICRCCKVTLTQTILRVDGEARLIGVKRDNYPEGYLMERGSGRLTAEDRDIIRYETLHQDMLRQARKH